MVHDLSKQHELVGDLFSVPEGNEALARFSLSDDQLQFYEENGKLKAREITDPALMPL